MSWGWATSWGQTGSFGGQAEMGQNFADGVGLVDAGDEAELAAATLAAADVLLKNAGSELGIGEPRRIVGRQLLVLLHLDARGRVIMHRRWRVFQETSEDLFGHAWGR